MIHAGIPNPSFPPVIKYGDAMMKGDDVQRISDGIGSVQVESTPIGEKIAALTPSTIIDSEIAPERTLDYEENGTTLQSSGFEVASTVTKTHTSDITKTVADSQAQKQSTEAPYSQASSATGMLQALQSMMRPERMTQGDTQSCSVLNRHQSVRHIEIAPSAQSSLSANNSSPVLLPVGQKLILLPNVVRRLEDKRKNLREVAIKLVKHVETTTENHELFLCQCGASKNESNMVIPLKD